MTHSTRRTFIKNSGMTLAGLSAGPAILSSADPNKKLSIACVGVGGKGWSDMLELAPGNDIVAI